MKFRQIGLYVSELNRAVDFYTQILGQEPLAKFDPPGFAFFDLGGVRLLLDVNAPKSAIYLEVPDVKTTTETLTAFGVRIINQPHIVFSDDAGIFGPPGNEWLAFVEDSEGNLVGLMSRETFKI